MGRCLLFSLVLFLIAVLIIAVSVITGGSDVALFIVFPVIYGGDVLLLAGVALLMASFNRLSSDGRLSLLFIESPRQAA